MKTFSQHGGGNRFACSVRTSVLATVILAVVSIAAPATVFGWGPGKHQDLAEKFYQQPIISSLAIEFGTNVSAVTSGAGELDYAGDPHHALYHSGQWVMVGNREYAYTSSWSSNKWAALDETTRLKYMMHNLGDVAVPIGHSPSNMVVGGQSGTAKEAILEGLADFGSYGSPSTPTSWYSGTVFDITRPIYGGQQTIDSIDDIAGAGKYQLDDITNALAYAAGRSNESAAKEGWRISQMLARVVLADYYLSRRNAAAASQVVVTAGSNVTFDASAIRDPDNITWNTDGSYYYRGDWTGISQVRWDFNGDDVYDATGVQVARSYSQLASAIDEFGNVNYKIEVTDDEGVQWYGTGTASVGVIPEPATGWLILASVISALLWKAGRKG